MNEKLKRVSPNTFTFIIGAFGFVISFIAVYKVEPLYTFQYAFLGLCCLNLMILSQVFEILGKIEK